ncbi:tyrosine-type recombinase/integrase [Sphingomonas adhaesiva]|uniref:tyrosine-type recombinase/integrase n=1 Tax=Sphingomonas adhaesiva TaxID=28212 RepID=UPI002FF7C958
MPATVRTAPPGTHLDNDGLYLLVSPTGARSWFLRVQVDGRRRDIGLGRADTRNLADRPPEPVPIPILQRKHLTLKEAREKAKLLREVAKAGLDPIAERDRERKGTPTFKEAALAAHAVLKVGLTEKVGEVFLKSLENHVFKTLGSRPVDKINAADITATLSPIWTSKPDMARKVRQRIGKVLNFAHNKGWRPIEAPSNSVSAGLPRQPKGGNYDAMPYADVPAFVRRLRSEAPTQGRRAVLLQIFTAARPGEVRRGRWDQIDLAKRDWNRPVDIMKERKAHTVTLNAPAAALLEEMQAEGVKPGALFFPNRNGEPLSDMTASKALRAAGLKYDAHGFRSSFRDWAAEQMPHIPDAVAEAALAHSVSDATIAAYKRTSFIQMRRELLEAWGAFVTDAGRP